MFQPLMKINGGYDILVDDFNLSAKAERRPKEEKDFSKKKKQTCHETTQRLPVECFLQLYHRSNTRRQILPTT